MKVRADLIAKALAKKHEGLGDFFITQCKSGPTTIAARGALFIFDAIAVKKSWTRPCVTIYEIKTDRQDFLSDEKWPQYRKFCHKFYFVAPTGLILSGEISDGCGLITYNPESHALYTAKRPVFTDVPLPTNVFYYILMNKLEVERHPFFSETREYFSLLAVDKEEKTRFGVQIRSKLLDKVKDLQLELAKIKRDREIYKPAFDELQKIKALMQAAGYGTWGIVDKIERVISEKGLPAQATGCINRLENEIKYLKEMVK